MAQHLALAPSIQWVSFKNKSKFEGGGLGEEEGDVVDIILKSVLAEGLICKTKFCSG